MLEESQRRMLASLADDDLVLDVGAWGKPFPRADWVIDLRPFETRGLYRYDDVDRRSERFDSETWVVRDICAHQPWPFDNDQFDFVICSHTLEDIRDPVWVCEEIVRVGRAGYVEVPSRIEEQAVGIQGRWAGWDHHRWFCDVDADGIEFVHKAHYVHGHRDCQLPGEEVRRLPEAERRQTLWWSGSFEFRERFMENTEELHSYLASFVRPHARAERIAARARRRLRALTGR